MKIKKVGETQVETDNDLEKSKDNVFASPKNFNKKFLFTGIGIFFIAICLILYFFVFSREKNLNSEVESVKTNNSFDALKQKELELKEKELLLKEKEMNMNLSSNQSAAISKRVEDWINDINNRSSSIGLYYAPYVDYYSWGVVPKYRVLGDKNDFFKQWDTFYLEIKNPVTSKLSENKYLYTYDKKINSTNYFNGKVYEAKVHSRMILENENNEWLITEENDPEVYYKKKNW